MAKPLDIAHFSLWAPGRAGLFHAVIDMIKYERKHGCTSRFINCDVRDPDPKRFEYEGITAESWKEAEKADVWVMHRMIPYSMEHWLRKKPSVFLQHGTNEIMVLHDIEDSTDKKFKMHCDFINTYTKYVALTKWDYDIMKSYDNGRGKVVYINDAIDMEKYSLNGLPWEYRYHPALLMVSNIRINKNPSPFIWAMPRIMELVPSARLNIFGLNLADIEVWKHMVLGSNAISISVENIHNQFSDLRPFMRGADISFNANYNGIFSRGDMESLACGTSVIAFTNEHTKYVCDRSEESIAKAVKSAWDDLCMDPEGVIKANIDYAKEHFCMDKKVRDYYIPLYKSII